MQQRNVLLHHHIFKNAGTTFERVLDENYGDGHIKFDGPFSFSVINQDQLSAIIQRHPNAMAFPSDSPACPLSHTLQTHSRSLYPQPDAADTVGVPLQHAKRGKKA